MRDLDLLAHFHNNDNSYNSLQLQAQLMVHKLKTQQNTEVV